MTSRRPHDDEQYQHDIIGTKPAPREDTAGLGPLFTPNPYAHESAVARDSDPITSHHGADHIAPKRGTLRALLLDVYRAYPDGLTDEEACERAGIPDGWKRCSELRNLGLIAPMGTRLSSAGVKVRVCAITEFARGAA